MKIGKACQVQLSTMKILNSMQYGLFFTISHEENINCGLDGTVTVLMVTEKQFTVSHSAIQ